MQDFNGRLEEWEMKANGQKTRVMRIGRKQDVCNVEVKLMVRKWSRWR